MCIICTTLFIYCLCISDFALLQHSINFQPFSEVLSAQYMRDGQALLLTIAPGLALHWQKWECLSVFTVLITMVAKYLIFTLGMNETFTG